MVSVFWGGTLHIVLVGAQRWVLHIVEALQCVRAEAPYMARRRPREALQGCVRAR